MKVIRKIGYKMFKVLWKITKPVTAGARVLLVKDGKILLVKHTYQEQWYLPGGGLKKGETFEEAIKREIKEEIGGQVSNLKLLGVYNNFYENKNDHVVIFVSNNFTITGKTDREIEEYRYFDLNNLPEKVSRGTKKRINEYISDKYGNYGLW